MKKIMLLFLIIIVSFLGSLISLYLYNTSNIIQVNKFFTDVDVWGRRSMGANLNQDALHFGNFPPGNSATRELIVHYIDQDAIVKIKKTGEIAKWITNEDEYFVEAGKNLSIPFQVKVPHGVELRNYTGYIYVIFYKP